MQLTLCTWRNGYAAADFNIGRLVPCDGEERKTKEAGTNKNDAAEG